jgi:hypothetical protein
MGVGGLRLGRGGGGKVSAAVDPVGGDEGDHEGQNESDGEHGGRTTEVVGKFQKISSA